MTSSEIFNNVVEEILTRMNWNWSRLEQIRYIYLELGKYLEKNTDFFLNDKLDRLALSKEEMDEIYKDNKMYTSNRGNRTQYQITCRSAAEFLKTACEKLGLEYTLLHTVGSEENTLHWFIAIKNDETQEQYFLTLAADLPFIKNNFPTEHFANDITYFSPSGEQLYVIPEDNTLETDIETYKGEDGEEKTAFCIKHTSLSTNTEGLERLREVDKKIGYSSLYESTNLVNNMTLQKEFYAFINVYSPIYKRFRDCFGLNKYLFANTETITNDNVDNFIIAMQEEISKMIIDRKLALSEDNAIKELIYNSLNSLGITDIDKNLDYKELLNKYKKELRKLDSNSDYKEMIHIVHTLRTIEERFLNFLDTREQSKLLDIKVKDALEKESTDIYTLQIEQFKAQDAFEKAKEDISINKLAPLLDKIAYTEFRDLLAVDPHEYVSFEYIVNKFNMLFPLVFDVNSATHETVSRTSFSTQGYSEQITIFKSFLKKMFPELTYDNCKDATGYNENYSAVENRIQSYPLKDASTGEYCIGIKIGGKTEESEVTYIYIPSENRLRYSDLLEDFSSGKYVIVSERFNKRIQMIEDIENKNLRQIQQVV